MKEARKKEVYVVDVRAVKRYDRSDMLAIIGSFPDQCRDAKRIAYAANIPDAYRRKYDNIVCTGLGGSAIGADIARSYIADEAMTPLSVNRNYLLPKYVSKGSLVVVSSYSGNTEETISAYKDARAKGASIVAITSGGEIRKMSEADRFPAIIIPGGLPPRCALGYSFFSLLILLSRTGVIGDKSGDIDEAIDVMAGLESKRLGLSVNGRANVAKNIAGKLCRKYPVIYSGQDRIDSVAVRWRGQLAENSKTIASSHVFPEMNHNEIVGWENPGKLIKDFAVIMLRDKDDYPRNSVRMDITKKIIRREKVEIIELESIGKSVLARIFSLVYIGDFVSFYLAILNKRDPTPVERIAYLKKELAKT